MEAEVQREMSEIRAVSSTQRATFLLNSTHPKRARLLASLGESGRPPTPPPQYEDFSTHIAPSESSCHHNSEFNQLPQVERQVRIVVDSPWWYARRTIAIVIITNVLILGAILGGVLGSARLNYRGPSGFSPISMPPPFPTVLGSPPLSTSSVFATTITSIVVDSQVTMIPTPSPISED